MKRIVVLYCGTSQLKPLMDCLVRLRTYPIVVPSNTPVQQVADLNPAGIIITGSPYSVMDIDCPTVDLGIYELGIPVLGVCYGMQRMAFDLGGAVARMPKPERSKENEIIVLKQVNGGSILYSGFTDAGVDVWMFHSCQVVELPEGFVHTGKTKETPLASMERGHLFGVQFHPEGNGEGSGRQILTNFITRVCPENE